MIDDYETAEELRERAKSVEVHEAFQSDGLRLDFTQPAELPPVPDGEVMVVSSIRLPVDLAWRAKKVAAARGIPTSALLREWIADGLEAAEAGQERDPATELHAIADAANRALRTLEGQRHAA